MADLQRITDLNVQDLQKRLSKKNITLDVSKGVRDDIAQKAFAEEAGARPIRRLVQELLEDPIAASVVTEELVEGHSVQARKTGGQIKVTPVKPAGK